MSEPTTEAAAETTAFDQLNILLESIEQHPEEAVRNHVRALVYTLLDLHHGALRRIAALFPVRSVRLKLVSFNHVVDKKGRALRPPYAHR